MKTHKKIGGWVATWLATQLLFTVPLSAQAVNIAPSSAEQYLVILRLQKAGNHDQMLAESKKLIESDPQFARGYTKLIEAANTLNRLPSVKEYFEAALKNNPANAQAHYGLALFHRQSREYTLVVEQAQLCIQMAPGFVPAYTVLTNAHRSMEKPDEAEAFFKSIPLGHPGFAAASYGLGYLYYLQRRWPESLLALDLALASEPGLLDAQQYKAFIFYYTNRYPEALTIYQFYFEAAKSKADMEHQTRAQVGVGTILRILGEHTTALENLTSGLNKAEEIGDRTLQLTCVGNLAGLKLQQDDYAKALSYGTRWLELAELLKDKMNAGRAQGHLGVVYRALGHLEQAITASQQSIALSREVKDEYNLASVLTDLAGMYTMRKDYQNAKACLTEALPLTRKLRSQALEHDSLASQAHLQYVTGNYLLSWDTQSLALQLAREMKTPLREGNSLNYLGALKLKAAEWTAAQQFFEQALTLGEKIKTPSLIWQAHTGLAAVAVGQGRLEQGHSHYQLAIEAIEQTRIGLSAEDEKAGFFQDKIEVYQKQIALLMKLHRTAPAKAYATEAFHYAERARARALLDSLRETPLRLEQELPSELQKQRQDIQTRFSRAEAELRKAASSTTPDPGQLRMLEDNMRKITEEFRSWQAEVRRRNPRFDNLRYPEPLTVEQVQQMLRNN